METLSQTPEVAGFSEYPFPIKQKNKRGGNGVLRVFFNKKNGSHYPGRGYKNAP
jgi:hypothetical protein